MSGTSKEKKRKLPIWMTQKKDEKNTDAKKEKVDGASTLLLNMEPMQYDGTITYSYNSADCSLLCEELLEKVKQGQLTSIGFDMEWPVTYKAGSASKTALIQLCPSICQCYLFHISCMSGFPKALKLLLEEERCLKVGMNIECDMWKLGRDFDFASYNVIKHSMADIGKLANVVSNSKENWSLDGLCQNLFFRKLIKEDSIRKGDWSHYPLTDKQKLYAATDAYASLLVYKELQKRAKCTVNDT